MITLGQVLAQLEKERLAGCSFAQDGIEAVLSALHTLGDDEDNYVDWDNNVLDSWQVLAFSKPQINELVVVARDFDVYSTGPVNGFVARYVEDSGVNGWEVTNEDGQKIIRTGYNDDQWKRI